MNDLLIRPIRPDDAAAFYAFAIDPAVADGIAMLPSMELGETERWLAGLGSRDHQFVAEIGGQVVACAGLTLRWNPRAAHIGQLNLAVARPFWGRGMGTALITHLLDFADNWLNLGRVEVGVLSHNDRALRLLQRVGFEAEVVRRLASYGAGRWADEVLMARMSASLKAMERPDPNLERAPAATRPLSRMQLTVRPVRPSDAAAMHAIRIDRAVARTTHGLPSMRLDAVEGRLTAPEAGFHRLVAETDGQVVGFAALQQPVNPRLSHGAGLGLMVRSNAWGRGVGSELMAALLDLADNWLNLKRVELEVHTDNPGAIHLYEKFGFEVEGTRRFQAYGDGRWTDSLVMARIRARE